MSFIIAAAGRSGTMMLTTALNSHPDLVCHGEKPNLRALKGMEEHEGANLRYSRLGEGLEDHKVIHNIRQDLLAHAISHWVHKHRDQCARPAHGFTKGMADLAFVWRISKQRFFRRLGNISRMMTTPMRPIVIDPAYIEERMEAMSSRVLLWHERLQDRALTVLHEDITKGRDATVVPKEIGDQICGYLGVEPRELTIPLRKSLTPDYASWIVNWEEVRRVGRCYVEQYQEVFGFVPEREGEIDGNEANRVPGS